MFTWKEIEQVLKILIIIELPPNWCFETCLKKMLLDVEFRKIRERCTVLAFMDSPENQQRMPGKMNIASEGKWVRFLLWMERCMYPTWPGCSCPQWRDFCSPICAFSSAIPASCWRCFLKSSKQQDRLAGHPSWPGSLPSVRCEVVKPRCLHDP